MTSLTTNNEDLYSKIFAGWDDTNSNFNEAVTNASLSGLSVIRLTSNSEVAKPKERGDDNNTKKKERGYYQAARNHIVTEIAKRHRSR